MRTVIFDFDGTIGDSFKIILEIGHELTHHKLLRNPEEIERLKNEKILKIADELGIKKYQWPILLFRGRKMMTKRLGEVKPFDGIKDVLHKLKKNGFRLFIISSNSNDNIEKFLKRYKLNDIFEDVHGGVGIFGKARALKKLIKKFDIDKETTVYVGDEPRDITSSREAGIPCISVSWGFNTEDLLLKSNPMVVVRSSDELLKVLQGWGN